MTLQNYGDIEYVRILKDKATGNSKGLAYVKYFKASNAALAFENCDQRKLFSILLNIY